MEVQIELDMCFPFCEADSHLSQRIFVPDRMAIGLNNDGVTLDNIGR